ncbi:hypothetical protein D3C78_1031150 [compost metagenome]
MYFFSTVMILVLLLLTVLKLCQSRFTLLGLGGGLFFVYTNVTRQIAANEHAVAEGTQAGTDDWTKDWHQEVRDITRTGEGHFAPAGQISEHFRAEVTRRVQRKAG